MFRSFFKPLTFLALAAALHAADKPNFIFILCDDLGYGDVRCLNPEGKIATPNMDRIAKEGVTFTDAHTPSSVCTPTRYGTVTGRYNWRTKLQSGVLGGLSPHLIATDRMTVASLLKAQGYNTACIGKWHLGMDWVIKEGQTVSELTIESREQAWSVDFTQPAKNGPNSVGFDYYFGISASLDMVPYCFIENGRVTVQPTEDRELEMVQGETKRYTRKGPAAPGFTGYEVLPTLASKASAYVAEKAADAKAGKPFFIYLPFTSPHTPILPNPEWRGKSGLNQYGDFVMETDAAVGRVLKALDDNGLAENTVVVLTSDNGCSPSADYPALLAKGHNPSGKLRGHKADIYDGGHRVPFLVRWPAKVKGGQTTTQLTCLTDFMATTAEITGTRLPDNAAEDSFSFLPVLLGQESDALRQSVVHHSIGGYFAIREGKWKLAFCPGSGGWSEPRPGKEPKDAPSVQLFDLEADLGEQTNLQAEHPEVVANLTMKLKQIIADGRSTPGDKQTNDVPVDMVKPSPPAPKKGKKK
ncbi:Arylsulfatase A [Prosthecobacter debontii]|uniref:Arylsulfatase A n=1 Tax=Prosthecobacter debontii TaxID=48467 RepID=A0A1T4WHK5_9BACT|nr:arylsulfatase [Prosthecobacter debontii]SKA76780.1 Arylsulfatase A [Prosthecobacter debontii]